MYLAMLPLMDNLVHSFFQAVVLVSGANSQPLFLSLLPRGFRNMRKACCTCGAVWTANVFAKDEYIYPALPSDLRDGFGGCPLRGEKVRMSASVADLRMFARLIAYLL